MDWFKFNHLLTVYVRAYCYMLLTKFALLIGVLLGLMAGSLIN